MLMRLEMELIKICEEVVELLYELREKSLISEEEFSVHSKQKLKFIRETKITPMLQ